MLFDCIDSLESKKPPEGGFLLISLHLMNPTKTAISLGELAFKVPTSQIMLEKSNSIFTSQGIH